MLDEAKDMLIEDALSVIKDQKATIRRLKIGLVVITITDILLLILVGICV